MFISTQDHQKIALNVLIDLNSRFWSKGLCFEKKLLPGKSNLHYPKKRQKLWVKLIKKRKKRHSYEKKVLRKNLIWFVFTYIFIFIVVLIFTSIRSAVILNSSVINLFFIIFDKIFTSLTCRSKRMARMRFLFEWRM